MMADEAKEGKNPEEATQEEKPAEGEGAEGEGAVAAPSKKKKLAIMGAAVVALVFVVLAALHFTGVVPIFGGKKHDAGKEEAEATDAHGKKITKKKQDSNLPAPPVTFEMEEFLVNLDTPGKQARFLKMTIALELPTEEDKEAIKPYVPRIRDAFQLYLRELREDDVKGSAALYRLREELMLRLSKVVYPIKVNDILFKEILTQ